MHKNLFVILSSFLQQAAENELVFRLFWEINPSEPIRASHSGERTPDLGRTSSAEFFRLSSLGFLRRAQQFSLTFHWVQVAWKQTDKRNNTNQVVYCLHIQCNYSRYHLEAYFTARFHRFFFFYVHWGAMFVWGYMKVVKAATYQFSKSSESLNASWPKWFWGTSLWLHIVVKLISLEHNYQWAARSGRY